MSTYRYRGDLKTTGDQLRLRDGGSEENKKPVEIKAEDNDVELILSSPKNTSLAGMDEVAGKKEDEIVGVKATQTLENKSVNADNNTISELELDNLKDGVLIDSEELVASVDDNLGDSTGNHIPADADDTMLLSALAIKTYVDARDAEQDDAIETNFNPANSDLTDTNVQAAIDTLANSEVAGDDLSTTGGGNLTADRVITLRDNPIIPGTEYVKIPAGDTDGRPNSASQAMMRYNTDTDQIEKYDGAEWAQVGGGGLEVVLASTNISPAEVSTHYLVDTSSSSRTITLPDSLDLTSADTKKAVIRISDIGENSETNNITINASGSDVIKMDGVTASNQLIFDVNGTWIQLALNGTTWHVDDVFWNNVSDDTITSVYLGANYYNKTELNSGQLDNRYYTETEINNKLSLKYDASNPNEYETPSELDDRDTANRARANHTGTQLANTISNFDTAVASNSAVAANTAKVSADGSINTHSDVDTTTASPNTGEALVWDGTKWAPAEVVSVTALQAAYTTGSLAHGTSYQNIRYLSGKVNDDASVFEFQSDVDAVSEGVYIKVLEDGLYYVEYTDWSSDQAVSIGVTKLSNLLYQGTDVLEVPDTEWAIAPVSSNSLWTPITAAGTVKLSAGDILTPHTNRAPDAEDGVVFRVTQISKL